MNGSKTFDALSYDPYTREKITLVQCKTNLATNVIKIASAREITFQKYMEWHDEGYKDYTTIFS